MCLRILSQIPMLSVETMCPIDSNADPFADCGYESETSGPCRRSVVLYAKCALASFDGVGSSSPARPVKYADAGGDEWLVWWWL